ncbi:MAG: DUF4426 domain-containing protein [Gammaproteobacteria bacterium]|nr:DUF4426 domain-containing protein [Gammaproteobacteria bacterium]
MTITRVLVFASVVALAAACGGPGESADVPDAQPAGTTFEDIGDHVVHFSAQTTDQLPREVAQAYQIQRSPDRAMLNVSVIRKSDGAPVKATVFVKTRNLTQQLKNVEMREINEQSAVYYIGETKIANRETLIFELTIKPDGIDRSSNIRFQKQFFTD